MHGIVSFLVFIVISWCLLAISMFYLFYLEIKFNNILPQHQEPLEPSMAFNLGTFEIRLEVQEPSNADVIEQDFLSKESSLPKPNDTPEQNRLCLQTKTDKLDNGSLERLVNENATSFMQQKSEARHEFHGGHFILILDNGLSSVKFKFPRSCFEDEPIEVVDVLKVRKTSIVNNQNQGFSGP